MTNAEWYFWLGVGAVIVLVAAVLLLLVWFAARRILNLAVVALDLVQQIKTNTGVIWSLEKTNDTAQNILVDAEAIRTTGSLVAHALHGTDVGRRGRFQG